MASIMLNCQTEIKLAPNQIGTRTYEINDLGNGVGFLNIYHYESNSYQAIINDTVTELFDINNNGDLTGLIRHPNTTPDFIVEQPGFKLSGGQWNSTGLADDYELTSQSISKIWTSNNGLFLTGKLPEAYINNNQGYAFRYNTQTFILENVKDYSISTYLKGNAIANNGIISGKMIPIGFNNFFPVTIDNTNSTNYLYNLDIHGEVFDMTSDGYYTVGFITPPLKPSIYSTENSTNIAFSIPDSLTFSTFTGVSNNGIAIGFHEYDNFYWIREAIIHHPSLGDSLIFIKDLLSNYGVELPPQLNGNLGTAWGISPSGEYICGMSDYGADWVIKLDLETLGIPSVAEMNEHASFELFPNPTNGNELTLQFSHSKNEPIPSKFIDANGKVLTEFTIQTQVGINQVDLSKKLPLGVSSQVIYLKMDFGNRIVTKGVVVGN